MQMTHEDAHRLIQRDLDRLLHADQHGPLLAHLNQCATCRAYADGMHDMENILQGVMRKQWNDTPLPLSIASLKTQNILAKGSDSPFGLRTALVSVVLVFFSILVWQFTISAPRSSEQTALTIHPVPTPSIQLTRAGLEAAQCESSVYKVKQADTLESIALQYSVAKEDIMTLNNMNSELIYETMELKIPQCTATPTMTARVPTTTIMPLLEVTIHTPG
jgi:hypothetical protein